LNIETIRRKQRALMVRMVERKVRERAQQLYEERGQKEGQALGDWVQAETEILRNSILAPLYRRLHASDPAEQNETRDFSSPDDGSACQTLA